MDGEARITSPFWTETSEGPIHHKEWNGLRCPVKLDRIVVDTDETGRAWHRVAIGGNSWPRPKRDNTGELVYAVPGGGDL